MQAISDGIYYQDAYAGVVIGAIITPQGTLLIDSPLLPEEARSWKSILLTQSRGTHRLLVNLDEHIDRSLGNRFLDFSVLTHQSVADALDDRSTVFKGINTETGSEWEKYPEIIGSRWIQPNITFDDHLYLHWGKSEIKLLHMPGPTRGSIWVEVPSEGIVFVGDAVIENQPPFLAKADIPAWLESLSLLRSRKYGDYIIVSGRSGPVTTEAVQEQQAFLKSLIGRMETLAKRESSPEDTKKMIPALLGKLKYPKKNERFYTQRLIYGLRHYYSNHYTPSELTPEE
jgi:glyoxylase-like metal-dependent hydrolase (beta-lactamase superfamily II)